MQHQQQPESKSRVDKMDDVEIVEEAGGLKPAYGGLNDHAGLQKTPEEAKAERRFVWKIDLLIMPLISITYFLGSMVYYSLRELYEYWTDEYLGSWRHWKRCCCGYGETAKADSWAAEQCSLAVLRGLYTPSIAWRSAPASDYTSDPARRCSHDMGNFHVFVS